PGGVYFGDVPLANQGDEHWLETYTEFNPEVRRRATPDIEKLATTILRRIDPALDLDTLRFGVRLAQLVEPRRQLIDSLLAANCRRSAIARFLCISPSAVSKRAALIRDSVATTDSRVGPTVI